MERKLIRGLLLSLVAVGVVFSWVPYGQGISVSLDDLDPVVRSAAADTFTQICNDFGSVNYETNGLPGLSSAEGRRAGLSCQRTDMLSGAGDPFVTDADGVVINATTDAQPYAAAAVAAIAPSASLERRYARAQAAVLAIRDGFAIVPGGPSEAFNRVQSCLAGSIQTNEDNLVAEVSIDCGEETVRRAVAELIAPGFYLQFGSLVGFNCSSALAQASGGPTVESRWAASLTYVTACSPVLSTTAAGGGELGFAAVARLAAAGGTGASSSSENVTLANAYADGLAVANTVSINSAGNPEAGDLGNLFAYSLDNFGTADAFRAHAPLARYLHGPGEVRISIAKQVEGANLPLIGTVLLRN